MKLRRYILACAAGVCPLAAQWTVQDAVRRAGSSYAGVRVSLEQSGAAAAALLQARTAYLPRGDFYAQVNRATRNNLFGMLLPNPVIPAISGPVQTANAGTNVWGSATGFLIQWEPFDLGQRGARVAAAGAARERAERQYLRTRFDVETAAADAFLTILAAGETASGAQAALERASSLAGLASAQARAGLRPEADASRARAERAAAEAQLIQARQAERTARIALAELTAARWEEIDLRAPFALRDPPEWNAPGGAHPALREQQAAATEAELRRREAALAWRPRFQTQSALYARGSGDAAQIGPHFYNWGVAFSVLFPFLDLPSIRAQEKIQTQRARAEQARADQVEASLTAQMERARAAFDAARGIARTVPEQLAAARDAYAQARARYQAGLASIAEAAEAQRLLSQAEIDAALARLQLWRAHLALAAAAGDLQPFLESAQ